MNAPTTFNTLMPPTDMTDAAATLLKLLNVLTDVEGMKRLLEELAAQETAAKEQIAALNAMAGDTRRLHSTAQATEIVLNNRKTALDAREGELNAREERIETAERRQSDANLRSREATVEAGAEANKRERERLAADRADLESRLDKIKSFSTTLG